ncbi:MAG: 2-dehydropantoate 2-reductase [Verrucomicrobia bacterium]|nr:2-dehydropantoate 2-reductase [Verrucomicrobiota bacterium]
MKIAVVGCGAVGSYYGARLCRDGQEVHFLLRSDYDVVRRRGVRVISPEGDFHVQPRAAKSPEEIGVCDLVLIGLKTTANDQFPKFLPPLVGPRTAILTLQNGLGNEAQLARLFPAEQILGGLCFVCLNRVEPGVIHHLAHGTIVLGEHLRWPEPRTHDIASMIRHSGVPCKVADNLERAHWEKLIWNIPFNGLGVASAAGLEAVEQGRAGDMAARQPCLTTDQLLSDARWENLVRELMLEVIAAARALGHALPVELAEKQISRTRVMGAYRASTLVDFERGQPLELESLFLEPLRQARKAGAATPRLAALCAVLEKLNPSQNESRRENSV